MNFALAALTFLCLIAIGVLCMMGLSYHTVGTGLHPAASALGIVLAFGVGYKACTLIAD